MKKYIKPSIEIIELEVTDIMTASGIVDGGESSYTDKNGNTIFGKEGTFNPFFESIF